MSTRCMSCEGKFFVSEFDHRTNPGENGRQCQESIALVRWGGFQVIWTKILLNEQIISFHFTSFNCISFFFNFFLYFLQFSFRFFTFITCHFNWAYFLPFYFLSTLFNSLFLFKLYFILINFIYSCTFLCICFVKLFKEFIICLNKTNFKILINFKLVK